jgi:hypothetical protein
MEPIVPREKSGGPLQLLCAIDLISRPSIASREGVRLPDGAVRWFDTRPLPPARPGHANHIDDSAERHYTKECQPT